MLLVKDPGTTLSHIWAVVEKPALELICGSLSLSLSIYNTDWQPVWEL